MRSCDDDLDDSDASSESFAMTVKGLIEKLKSRDDSMALVYPSKSLLSLSTPSEETDRNASMDLKYGGVKK